MASLVSAVAIGFCPSFVLRLSFDEAMDFDHPNLLDPSSYQVTAAADARYVLPFSVSAEGGAETYGYGYEYGYEYGAYGGYSQQTPTFVDISFIGEPNGSYSLRIVKPLLSAGGEWLCAETVWDDGETIWDDGETVWDLEV